MSAQTILVVDDSTVMRRMVRGALEADRHRVVEASDGRAALRMRETATADLVITDVNMPEMDGLSLVRALREQARHRFTPILVLTMETDAALKERGRAVGATGWLVKPFDPEQLRQVVRRVMRDRDS
jgi:two-component system chemotaxis response regulator CheY